MFTSRFPLVLVALAVLVVSLSGCGQTDPTGTVKGVATLDGQPYSNAALILLHNTTGDGANVDLQADGSFAVPTPLKTGEYTVYLSPKAGSSTGEPVPVTTDTAVPDDYWNEAASPLRITVNSGENDVKLEMKK